MTVDAIQKEIGKTKAYTSALLSVMRMINIVKARRDGTNVYYSVADEKIAHACGAMQDVLAQLEMRTSAVHPIRARR
jgi:DNA-binding transcriptional ArsR family regulator